MVSSKTIKSVVFAGSMILAAASGYFAGNSKSQWFEKLPPTAKTAVFNAQTNAERQMQECIKLLNDGKIQDAIAKYDLVKAEIKQLELTSPTYHLIDSKVEHFEKFLKFLGFINTNHTHHINNSQRLIKYCSEATKNGTTLNAEGLNTVHQITMNIRGSLDIIQAYIMNDIGDAFDETHDANFCRAMAATLNLALKDEAEAITENGRALKKYIDGAKAKDIEFTTIYNQYEDKLRVIEKYREVLRERTSKY